MRQAGVFERVAGIVFGALQSPPESAQEHDLIRETVGEQTAGLKCPVLFGIEAGHGTENFTLPFGVRVRLDSKLRRLTIMEAAVS
jgi:muramoyltetrapeptide carboxypeptidase